MRAATLFSIITLMLLITPAASSQESDSAGTTVPDYGLGYMEGNIAYVNILEYWDPEITPELVLEIASGLAHEPYRELVPMDELSDFLPEWAKGPVLLIGPLGRMVAEPDGAFVSTDDCGWILHVGIEFHDPWAEEMVILEESEAPPNWVVATGSWLQPETGPNETEDAIQTTEYEEIVQERLDGYVEDFGGEEWIEPGDVRSWFEITPGNFEGCGGDGEEGGTGLAVFYCVATTMEFAGAVEILDEAGDVRVEASPWEGAGDFHGWFYVPVDVVDVDEDGWDEIIVHVLIWEMDRWELWDPRPDGTEVLASWSTGGC